MALSYTIGPKLIDFCAEVFHLRNYCDLRCASTSTSKNSKALHVWTVFHAMHLLSVYLLSVCRNGRNDLVQKSLQGLFIENLVDLVKKH
jgi:hypothetical protein